MTMMSKSELRKARKVAVMEGRKLVGILALKINKTASNETKRRKANRKKLNKPQFIDGKWTKIL